MLPKFARAAAVCVLCVSIAGHSVALQSAAWVIMMVEYAQHVPLPKALAQTFDGSHPCELCKTVAAGMQSHKKPASFVMVAKHDLALAATAFTLRPVARDFRFAFVNDAAYPRSDAPPVPPPRRLLS